MSPADLMLWIVGLFVLGVLAFVTLIVTVVLRAIVGVLRALFGGGRREAAATRASGSRTVCPHPRCGHLNRRGARFCGRCGRSLSSLHELDAYG